MGVVTSVLRDFTTYFSVKTKAGRIRLIVLVLALAAGTAYIAREDDTSQTPEEPTYPTVTLLSSGDLSGSQMIEYIGTVRTSNEDNIQSEAAGRVTRVNVSLGQTVAPGAIIATLENAAEYAALLQAEGSYEAAVASANVADVSVTEAEIAIRSAIDQGYAATEAAYATINGLYVNQLDFAVADEQNVYRNPGVLLASESARLATINTTYESLNEDLQLLQQRNRLAIATEVRATITDALAVAQKTQLVSDTVRSLVVTNDEKDAYDADEQAILVALNTIDSQLATVRSSLRSAEAQLAAADEALEKAQLSSGSAGTSVSEAQVKQALGSLRAAQARYNDTIIRTSTGGTVNELSVSVGDVIGSFTPVAQVINDGAFEITLFADERDLPALEVGTSVTIDNSISGVISEVAPGVNSTVGKVEFRVVSEDERLIVGDTVRVQIERATSNQTTESESLATVLPINAIKFQVEQGIVFTVSEESTLVAHTITIGDVDARGVEIISGLPAAPVVADARGLSAGERVTVK